MEFLGFWLHPDPVIVCIWGVHQQTVFLSSKMENNISLFLNRDSWVWGLRVSGHPSQQWGLGF